MNYSVLMSVYHKENPEYLRAAIDSMLCQTVKPAQVVLVCDGPLTPELDSVIDSFGDRLNVLRLEKNMGLGKALEEGLLKDPKELAEHNMLVDLGRNDLGKVSKFGSVHVDRYHCVLKYSHVMHIGSTVTSRIADDKDAMDAVDSILPAGTLSGAPKIRACQLINDLENNKRGIYGGAIGYLDFTGNLDTCIAIRIAYKKNGKVFVRSGAGIVADSVPENEYQECLNKAAAVVTALKLAGEVEE